MFSGGQSGRVGEALASGVPFSLPFQPTTTMLCTQATLSLRLTRTLGIPVEGRGGLKGKKKKRVVAKTPPFSSSPFAFSFAPPPRPMLLLPATPFALSLSPSSHKNSSPRENENSSVNTFSVCVVVKEDLVAPCTLLYCLLSRLSSNDTGGSAEFY